MDTCPKCGSEIFRGDADDDFVLFKCGTIYSGGYCDSQSPLCVTKRMFNGLDRGLERLDDEAK